MPRLLFCYLYGHPLATVRGSSGLHEKYEPDPDRYLDRYVWHKYTRHNDIHLAIDSLTIKLQVSMLTFEGKLWV